ncbi:DNA-binding protein [Nakamurella sp.]|uniref:DNA-binding protein n=1 Tax=Nakamurella sp. TaxID=1869182 RepID=UPI003B3A2E07
MDSGESLLTTRDLAHRWQVNAGSLANDRSASRGVPYVKIGGAVRYRLRDVEGFEANCRISTLDAS